MWTSFVRRVGRVGVESSFDNGIVFIAIRFDTF